MDERRRIRCTLIERVPTGGQAGGMEMEKVRRAEGATPRRAPRLAWALGSLLAVTLLSHAVGGAAGGPVDGSTLRPTQGPEASRGTGSPSRAKSRDGAQPATSSVESGQQGRTDGRVRGHPDAPITMIEFSDFTCGFCLKFFQETLPLIRLKYIETGKLRFMYRDFPRAFEGLGLEAAVASRCAGDQNQYWPMHDRLFSSSGAIQGSDFQRHAQALGLDLPAFSRCLEGKRHREAIFRDRELATKLGFRGTPGFLLIRSDDLKGKGELGPVIRIPGAVPYAVFEEQIDRLLGHPASKGKG